MLRSPPRRLSSSADFHAVGNARALALVTHRRFLTGRTTVVRTTLYMPSIDIPAPTDPNGATQSRLTLRSLDW